MTSVSICTSVYNQSDLLKGMIASVIGQSYKDWELIIVDDASTEDIKALCEEWNDDRIRYERLAANGGGNAGLNYAITLARGQYISFLSADERIDLNKLLWQVGYLDEHPEIGGLWGLPNNGPLGERPEWEQYATKAHNRSRESWISTLLNLDNIPIGGASWLTRKAIIDDIGGFDAATGKCGDLELFIRFFKKYEGRVMPYRWAWEDEANKAVKVQPPVEEFQSYLKYVRAKHPMRRPEIQGRVTVAIPVRDMAQYIRDTLISLQFQTFQDFDIVILDDASTDDTVRIVKEVADERTLLMQLMENIGPNAAQNHMLATCKTPFFVVLAADDTLDPTFLERCLAQFEANPWLEFVASQTDFIKADGTPLTEEHMLKTIRRAANKSVDAWLQELYYGNQYFGCGMYRTKAAKDVGGWDANAGVLADYDMYLKLLQRGNIHVIEENLTHTRVHDKQRSVPKLSPEESRTWQRDLRVKYHEISSRYYRPRMRVIIATPFYEMRGFSPYIASMVGTIQQLTRMNIEHEFWELSGDSYVDRAKNTLFNKFLEDPKATDLFMIDSDMQWDVNGFMKMLFLPESIVMGSYPQKNMWDMYTALPKVTEIDGKQMHTGRMVEENVPLIQAQFVAGGFMRIKREALVKYKEHYKDHVYHDMGADPSCPERLYTEFFTCERALGPDGVTPMRWGEDRVFGLRMDAIGESSWIYPNVTFSHYGIKGWQGNYHNHMLQGKKKAEAA